jgi:hypothetical protein
VIPGRHFFFLNKKRDIFFFDVTIIFVLTILSMFVDDAERGEETGCLEGLRRQMMRWTLRARRA